MASAATSEQKVTPKGDSNLNMLRPAMKQQNQSSLDGPVAVLWDIENCGVPSDVCPEDVAGNIRMALQGHPVINGAVKTFSAYGDFNSFPKRLREGCQRTGVKLIDVPNGRKDAADKAILVDMFLFALDNPSPSSIMLISGDVDFAPALHVLGQRGYTVILVIPSGRGVSSALCNAGKYVWDWPSVARGEGFVPPPKALKHLPGGPTELDGYFMGCHINDNLDAQNEEESIIYDGISLSYDNSKDFSMMSQSLSEYRSNPSITDPTFPATLSSHNLPSRLIEESGCPVSYDHNDSMWEQPGDINGLKGQLVKLLESSGGCLLLSRVPVEYQKMFGRPLYCSKYRAFELADLFKKMGDAMAIDGKGQKKFVYVRNRKASPNVPPVVPARKEKKGKKMGDAMAIDGKGQKKFVQLRTRKPSPSVPPVALARKEKKQKKMGDEMVIDGKGQTKFVHSRKWKATPNVPPVVLARKEKKRKKMGNEMAIDGKGQKKFVHRRKWKATPNVPPVVLARKEKKGKKMGDAMAIDGKGQKKFVHLKASPNVPPVVLPWKEKKGKETQEENMDFAPGGGSSDEIRMAVEEQDDRRNPTRISFGSFQAFVTSKEKGTREENIDFAPGGGSFDDW